MPSTRELLEECSAQGSLSASAIDALIQSKTPEDLFLDYKGGALVTDRNAQKLRSAVAAFANAEGGLLLLGINGGDVTPVENCWTVDGCPTAVGKQPVLEWISSSLRDIGAYLHPYPKIGLTEVQGKVVVFVATTRSGSLVPCVEGGRGIVHYLRFYGQSCPAPPYLLADLLLGRRSRPTFVVEPTFTVETSNDTHRRRGVSAGDLSELVNVTLSPRNASAVWATDPMGGILGQGLAARAQKVPPELLACVDGASALIQQTICSLSDSKVIRPFQAAAAVEAAVRLPDISKWVKAYRAAEDQFYGSRGRPVRAVIKILWQGALYLFCRESTPQWYQVEFEHTVGGDYLDVSGESPVGNVSRPSGLPVVGIYILGRHLQSGDWVKLSGSDPDSTEALVIAP